MKKRIIIPLFIVIVAVLIFFPYIKAEILTAMHGSEFVGLELETNMHEKSEYLKVVSYSHGKAEVVYVSYYCTDLFIFEKTEDGWERISWETLQSMYGSASEFMWPMYLPTSGCFSF